MRRSGVFLISSVLGAVVLGVAIGSFLQWKARLLPPGEPEAELREHDEHDEEEHGLHGGVRAVRLSEEERQEFGVVLRTAGPGTLEIRTTLPGEIVPDADTLAHLVSPVSGIAARVYKKLGESVKAGEVLAVIESRELAEAKAAYLAAVERLSLAQANFEREERLWKEKINSEREYLDAKQALAEARIRLTSAKNKLYALGLDEEAVRALHKAPEDSFAVYKIRAPFGGTIVKKHVTLGEVVGRDTELFVVADLSVVWCYLTVYQKDLGVVREGQEALIKADAIGAEARGKIDYVSPIVGEATRTATARVVLENEDGRWRPGMFVTGYVTVKRRKAEIVVPSSAILNLAGRTVVFVETPDGFQPREVKLGRSDGRNIEILQGLKAGERYVARSGFTLLAELQKASFTGGHAH